MSKLRKIAQGKACMVRLPGICDHGTDTTVLAHLRLAGITGACQKAPDELGAWCCGPCHNEVDRRTQALDADKVAIMFYEGIFRTQYELIKKGIIK